MAERQTGPDPLKDREGPLRADAEAAPARPRRCGLRSVRTRVPVVAQGEEEGDRLGVLSRPGLVDGVAPRRPQLHQDAREEDADVPGVRRAPRDRGQGGGRRVLQVRDGKDLRLRRAEQGRDSRDNKHLLLGIFDTIADLPRRPTNTKTVVVMVSER